MTPDPVGFSDGPNLYAYVHNSPLVLIDPYGLTTVEDARDVGVDTAMGAVQGFIHPLDTYENNCGYLVQFRRDVCNGDFSSITNTSVTDKLKFACARAGETAGMLAAAIPVAKVACTAVRVGSCAVGALVRSFVSRVTERTAEKSCVRAAESTVVATVEARAADAATCKTLTGAGYKSGPVKSEWVNLASKERTEHILYGAESELRKGTFSGGHKFPGRPGKTPFPKDWTDQKIMNHISDIATDPKIPWMPGKGGRVLAEGVRENLKIRVVISNKKGIVTGHPIP